jgi:hypothetical protein
MQRITGLAIATGLAFLLAAGSATAEEYDSDTPGTQDDRRPGTLPDERRPGAMPDAREPGSMPKERKPGTVGQDDEQVVGGAAETFEGAVPPQREGRPYPNYRGGRRAWRPAD